MPPLGSSIFEFANEPLLVTFELVEVRSKSTELAVDSLLMRTLAVTRARSRNICIPYARPLKIGTGVDTQQFACVDAEAAIIEAFCR